MSVAEADLTANRDWFRLTLMTTLAHCVPDGRARPHSLLASFSASDSTAKAPERVRGSGREGGHARPTPLTFHVHSAILTFCTTNLGR